MKVVAPQQLSQSQDSDALFFCEISGLALGASYTLTHAVTLLEDAAILYSQKRASSSFHLAVMAREELGRFNLLSELDHKLLPEEYVHAGEPTRHLHEHKRKLQAGQSFVPVPMSLEQLAVWVDALSRNDEAKLSAISIDLHARAKELKPHEAAALHQRRLKAQYVDLDSQTRQWSRPSDVTMADASALIRTGMAEIANALIFSQGAAWLQDAFATAGVPRPDMGPFTHRILARLGEGDA